MPSATDHCDILPAAASAAARISGELVLAFGFSLFTGDEALLLTYP